MQAKHSPGPCGVTGHSKETRASYWSLSFYWSLAQLGMFLVSVTFVTSDRIIQLWSAIPLRWWLRRHGGEQLSLVDACWGWSRLIPIHVDVHTWDSADPKMNYALFGQNRKLSAPSLETCVSEIKKMVASGKTSVSYSWMVPLSTSVHARGMKSLWSLFYKNTDFIHENSAPSPQTLLVASHRG